MILILIHDANIAFQRLPQWQKISARITCDPKITRYQLYPLSNKVAQTSALCLTHKENMTVTELREGDGRREREGGRER